MNAQTIGRIEQAALPFEQFPFVAAETDAQFAEAAANHIISRISAKPDLILCLPTGRTPLPLYARLREAANDGQVDFSHVRLVMVDEYVGAAREAHWSFNHYLDRELVLPLGLAEQNVLRIDGSATDPQAEAQRFENALVALDGLDLAVLGLGSNGHVAFNEPGSDADSPIRVVELAAETLRANAGDLSPDCQPSQAITIGLGTIRQSKSILLLVGGAIKQAALSAFVNQSNPELWPVSALRNHQDIKVLTRGDLLPPHHPSEN